MTIIWGDEETRLKHEVETSISEVRRTNDSDPTVRAKEITRLFKAMSNWDKPYNQGKVPDDLSFESWVDAQSIKRHRITVHTCRMIGRVVCTKLKFTLEEAKRLHEELVQTATS